MTVISKTLLCGVFLCFFHAVGIAQVRTGAFDVVYDDNGAERNFSVFVPPAYVNTATYPLITAIHGVGQSAKEMRDWFLPLTDSTGGILVCPNENDTWDGQVSISAVNYVRNTYSINNNRRIISGLSAGGAMASYLGWLLSEHFEGIIVVNPGITEIEDRYRPHIGKLPFACILGKEDPNYAAIKAVAAEISSAGAPVLVIEKPGIGHIDNKYFNSQEFFADWMTCYRFIFDYYESSPVVTLLPTGNTTGLLLPADFVWEAKQGGTEYVLQIATEETFAQPIVEKHTDATRYTVETLPENTTLWWRVAVVVNGVPTKWSAPKRYTVFAASAPTTEAAVIRTFNNSPFTDDTRLFSIALPDGYSPEHSYPLIIGLHGFNQNAEAWRTILKPLANSQQAIVICPDGKGDRHDDQYNGNEISIVQHAIDIARSSFSIDTTRQYVVGFSYGGRETMYYGLAHHTQFKGIIGVAAAIQSIADANGELAVPWANPFVFANAKRLPICVIKGELDERFNSSIDQFYQNVQKEQGRTLLRELPGVGHNAYEHSQFIRTLDECFAFINANVQQTILRAPADGANNQSHKLQLQWHAIASAEMYDVAISTNKNFTGTDVMQYSVSSNEIVPDALVGSTTYYWKVRMKNSTGEGEWSSVWSFTTMATTGVDEHGTANSTAIHITPQPASQYVVIASEQVPVEEIVLIDILGMQVAHQHISSARNQYVFSLVGYPAGTYVLRVRTGATWESKMIVVKP